MRRARAGTAARFAGIVVQRAIIVGFRQDSGRVVLVADFHPPFINYWLNVFSAEIGSRSTHVSRVGLLDRQRSERTALRVVSVEQSAASCAVDDQGQLPRQIVRVLHASVAAEAA